MSKGAYTSHDGFSQRLNVPASQAVALPKGYRHYTSKIAAAQTPTWGSWFTIPIREKGVSLDTVLIEFQVSAITATNTSGGTTAYLPAHFWAERIDIYSGSQLIESIPKTAGFLLHQLLVFPSEEKRLMRNTAAGLYSSHSTRATKSSATDFWYLPIASFWKQASFPLLAGSPDLEIRIQMAALADSITTSAGTSSSLSSTFSVCNAICQFSLLPASIRNYTSSLIAKAPLHFGFQDLQQQTLSLTSGSSSYSLVLSAITGFVSSLIFVIRSSSPTGSNLITYNTTLSTFEILSQSSENIVGGQPINDILSRLVQGGNWLNVTFLNESAGVYFYSFALDPKEVFDSNASLSGRTFTGSEVLKLNFSSSLSSNAQVDVYALTYATLELTPSGIKKYALSE